MGHFGYSRFNFVHTTTPVVRKGPQWSFKFHFKNKLEKNLKYEWYNLLNNYIRKFFKVVTWSISTREGQKEGPRFYRELIKRKWKLVNQYIDWNRRTLERAPWELERDQNRGRPEIYALFRIKMEATFVIFT